MSDYVNRHLKWRHRSYVVWIVVSLAYGGMIYLLPAVTVQNIMAGTVTIIAIGLINALIRPVIILGRISRRARVVNTITVIVNILFLWLADAIVPGFTVSSFWGPVLLILVVSTVNIWFSDLLAIDDDVHFYDRLVLQMVHLTGDPEQTAVPGVIFLEIDGLAEPILRQAMADGLTPTMSRWLSEGSHRLTSWECDLSSQTSASQAGILLGSNHGIPAFRWFEKGSRRRMVSNHLYDAVAIEERLSRGDGLLAPDGASRGNMFSGDALWSIFTFSTAGDMTRKSGQDLFPIFMGPFNALRIALLFIWDLVIEWRDAMYQRRHDVRPRVYRGGVYPFLRAVTTILLRELVVHILIGDMFSGVSRVYATFVGYDEVAHHSGIKRSDAMNVLHQIDIQFERLEQASQQAPRPYQFVVLSDHGQSQGATFRQRYELTLEELVQQLIHEEHTVQGSEETEAGWSNLSLFLTDLRDSLPQWHWPRFQHLLEKAIGHRLVNGRVVLGPYRLQLLQEAEEAQPEPANVVVMASGNLGLIYLTDWSERLNFEAIQTAFPQLLEGLAQHPGIGFVLVQTERDGPLVIGAEGRHFLIDGRIEGQDPLSDFGPHSADHLRRHSGFEQAPDILVNSLYDPEQDEVAAFEEKVGSHGGLGGTQTQPFILFPADWPLDDAIIGAEELHRQLKGCLNRCQTLDERPAPV